MRGLLAGVAAGAGVRVGLPLRARSSRSEPNIPPAIEYTVFCGLDVGKAEHHACALDRSGRRLHDRPLPNDEAALLTVFRKLTEHGPTLVIVDQPASIGALPIAVTRSLGIEVAYLPGLAMRRIADLHPGEGKTDARDAYVIADAARTMPHTRRRVGTDDETLAELTVLTGYDDDLAAQSTRLTNRLRDALLHVHPALERLVGPHLDRGGVLNLIVAAPTPQQLRALGEQGIAAIMKPRSRGWPRHSPARSSPRSTPRLWSSPGPGLGDYRSIATRNSASTCSTTAASASP